MSCLRWSYGAKQLLPCVVTIFLYYTILLSVRQNEMCVYSTDLVEFTDEEGYGRYLDLHDCYLKYINLKGVEV